MGTEIALMVCIARSDISHSGLFSESMAILSPVPMPREARPVANSLTCLPNSCHETVLVSSPLRLKRAGLFPCFLTMSLNIRGRFSVPGSTVVSSLSEYDVGAEDYLKILFFILVFEGACIFFSALPYKTYSKGEPHFFIFDRPFLVHDKVMPDR